MLASSDRLLRIEVIDAMSNRAATGMRVDVFTPGARARKIYFRGRGVADASSPRHLDTVPFRFATMDQEGYVLPVRVSPREFMLVAP